MVVVYVSDNYHDARGIVLVGTLLVLVEWFVKLRCRGRMTCIRGSRGMLAPDGPLKERGRHYSATGLRSPFWAVPFAAWIGCNPAFSPERPSLSG
jgi:hypothetical protein